MTTPSDKIRELFADLGWPARLHPRATEEDWATWLATIDLRSLGAVAEAGPACPECGGDLVRRSGRFGAFLGCSEFPDCRHTSFLN